jgi:hypothetical protein
MAIQCGEEAARPRWAQLCEETRLALPSVDLQSAEDGLDEMNVLTTPVGLSWWMIFAEVHQVNVFLLNMFTNSLWEPDISDPTASLLVQTQSQHACMLISRAGRLIQSDESENCMAVFNQRVSSILRRGGGTRRRRGPAMSLTTRSWWTLMGDQCGEPHLTS